MIFVCKLFAELSVVELYQILQLRSQVFVVEQNCVYQDMDNKDRNAYHLMGYQDSKLVATARLLSRGVSYENYCSIGRVCTHSDVRQLGYGRELMKKSIALCHSYFPSTDIKISAQSYLLGFYSSLGFQPIGEDYLEDNIPHNAMVYRFLTEQ